MDFLIIHIHIFITQISIRIFQLMSSVPEKKLTILLHVLSAFNYILTNEGVYCKG